jgi:hypothetical protein
MVCRDLHVLRAQRTGCLGIAFFRTTNQVGYALMLGSIEI